MKVILTQEVDNLGLAGDVVDVANGYGRNFLLPRGMAILATKGAMKEAEALTRSRKVAEAQTLDQAVEHRTTLEDRVLRIPARVDERGHLYGSVNVNDVHRVLKERGHEIEAKRIDLKGAIKEIGTYEIPVQVHPQVMATVTIDVVDEEGVVIAGEITEPEVAPLPGEVVEGEAADTGDDTVDDADDELARLEAEALAAAAELDAADAEADAESADDETADAESGDVETADA
ncbi:MAG TPA: 50S ribosomal protein L9 [Nitriliruptoraceae bacterium]|nr:50S ribosomal protein L9 [Nitriliruptoraceae bacterium]